MTTPQAEAKSSLLAGVDRAILIALATPIAYFIAFQFDRGYLNFFGVPDILVDVSLRDLLIAVVTMGSVAYSFYMFFDFVLIVMPEHWPQRIRRRLLWLVGIAVGLVLLRTLFEPPWAIFIVCITLVASSSIFLVVVPVRSNGNSIIPTEPPRHDPYAHKGLIPEMMRRGVGPHMLLGLFAIIAVGALAHLAGDGYARMRTTFLIRRLDDGRSCAVIRMRDTDFLCADFNMKTHRLVGDYQFLKPELTTLSLSETGRLQTPVSAK